MRPHRFWRPIVALFAVLTMLGLPGASSAQGASTISGVIVLSNGQPVPTNAIVTIQLADVSTAGVPGAIVTEQAFGTNGAQPPYAFTLAYNPERISPTRRYNLQGNIRLGGQILYTTATGYQVLTAGAYPASGSPLVGTTNLRITMYPPSSGGLPQSSGGGLPLLIAAGLLLAGLAAMALRRSLGQPA